MKNAIMKGASILTVLFMISMVFTPIATAAPVLPDQRYGIAYDSTATAIPTEYVLGFIDGVQYVAVQTDASGYFLIDVPGDDPVDATIKTGGVDGDTIQYVRSTGAVGLTTGGTFFTETKVYTAGDSLNADLNEVASSPALLKINNVSVDSTLTGVTDYIVLYNPTGGAVDATGYTISIDGTTNAIDATDLVSGLYAWNALTIPASGYLALNMGALSNTAGYITLFETATGFVVDRVEYGNIGNEALGETIMGNAVAPANGQEIQRTTAGTDTNECDVDFGTQANWLPIDTTAPTSSVDAIAAWFTASPQTVTATASDTGGSGLASVELFYNSGAGWVSFGVDSASPWSWSFTFPDGDGQYDLYTIATDVSGTVEAAPGAADTWIGLDTVAPTSSVDALPSSIDPATFPTYTVTATATDATSGVASVELFWMSDVTAVWTSFGVDSASPWSWSFTFPDGQDIYYAFYSVATDVAGNVEGAPAGNDTWTYYGTTGGGTRLYSAASAPTNVRIAVVGAQDTATDVQITWTDDVNGASYNIYRGTAADAIDFVTPLANVAQGTQSYTDAGAIAGASAYYYSIRTVDAGGIESESSATVGKFTSTYDSGYNSFGSPLKIFPEDVDASGHELCDWTLIDQTSARAIPSASTIYTYDYATQAWKSRTPTTPSFIAHYEINDLEDGIMVYMDATNNYTWVGWPAEQVRMPDFEDAGTPPLAAPANFDTTINGADINLTWDAVTGATLYEVFTATNRSLDNFNFGAPVYSGTDLTWTDTNAATTLGQTYYIVVAVDATGDFGQSAYSRGKYVRQFDAGYNSLTTPFEPFKGELDANGHQLCDWTLIDQTSAKAIPSASTIYTYDYATQAWKSRTPTTPSFIAHYEIPVMGGAAQVYMDATATYCWVS